MKATRAQIERAWGRDDLRLVLLYGPDEAGSRSIATDLGRAIEGAERVELTGAELRSDPARLADEAASISLFGERRFIRVEPAGDEALAAIDVLLSAPAAGNPVLLIAGALKKESKLLKLAIASPATMALASYAPEGADADRLVVAIGRDLGLRIRSEIAKRIATSSDGDRAVIARELEKFALFLDAGPDSPKDLDADALDALGAESSEGDLSHLIDAILLGRGGEMQAEAARLASGGSDAVLIVRTLTRRLLLLASMRADVDHGDSIDSVVERAGKAIFWKEKGSVARQLRVWNAAALAGAIDRMAATERALKSSSAVTISADQALLDLARTAQAR